MKPGEKAPSRHPPRSARQLVTRRWRNAAILVVLTTVIGVILLTSLGHTLEEGSGLGMLFYLRGVRHVPSNVVIVSLDRESSDQLGLSYDYSNWSHSYHARLIQTLVDAGATIIAFDVFFNERRSAKDDHVLAKAIGGAGNVVLVEDLRKKIIPMVKATSGSTSDSITVEQLVPPTRILADEAISVAPFPLPKVPVRVSRYWTFEQTGDVPTFPVVSFQIFALQAYGDLRALLSKTVHDPAVVQADDTANRLALTQAEKLLSLDHNTIKNADYILTLVRSLRKILGNDTLISASLRKYLEQDVARSRLDKQHRDILKALVNMYGKPNSRYLNFYGPPGTIPTVPYFQALKAADQYDASDGRPFDFKGKVVFIGYSDSSPENQGDFYNTVFSLPDGRDLSGVEIAATAFANLMEDMPIQPLSVSAQFLIIIFFGIVLGMICYLLAPLLAVLCTVIIGTLYLVFATFQFTTAGIWFPIMIPIAVQVPFAFTAAVLWKYYEARSMEVAHERLREIDRLKTMFLSQVSHELRAPLTSIQGFVENMLDGMTGDLQGKQREYLHRMRGNTERLTRMITNLLDLSRIESGTQNVNRIPRRLIELVEEVIRQFETVAQAKHITLDVVCEDPSLQILADHDKFVQILTNLVDNAIKFTQAEGAVTISLTRQDPNTAILTIKDTGVGIPADAMENLFEPFYQASQGTGGQAKGLGLGLSIVKSLIEIHGGTISVSSELGRGSEFRIQLPVFVEGG